MSTATYCLFRFPHRWPDIVRVARTDMAEAIELLDGNDRALDDALRLRPHQGGVTELGWDCPHPAALVLERFMSDKPGDREEGLRMLTENEESLIYLFAHREMLSCTPA